MKILKSVYFKLEKSYFDCIDEAGNCFIVYWATIKLCYLRFVYSALIFSDSDNIIHEKYSLRHAPRPYNKDLLSLSNRILKVKGYWKHTDDPFTLSLFKDENNQQLIWDCHHPKAEAEIEYNNQTYKGWGYAETIYLSSKPSKLPIEELRWGRFLSQNHTIIWNHWIGEQPMNILFYNGVKYCDATFEENKLSFGDGSFVLLFQETSIIRTGKLSDFLSKTPFLSLFLNNWILNSTETKCKAKAVLLHNDKTIVSGWSLYEVVKCKNESYAKNSTKNKTM